MAKNNQHPHDQTPEEWMISLTIGHTYYVRSARNDYVGRIISKGHHTVTLGEASWIAESGRLHVFLRDGRDGNMEIEPILSPGGIIGDLQVLEWSPWIHPLFRETIHPQR